MKLFCKFCSRNGSYLLFIQMFIMTQFINNNIRTDQGGKYTVKIK